LIRPTSALTPGLESARPGRVSCRLQETSTPKPFARSTTPGAITYAEIRQQPETWPETTRRLQAAKFDALPPPVLTGAGTSFFAALAVQSAWPGSRAVPSTELFLDFDEPLQHRRLVVSLARSGDSPESVAVVDRIRLRRPDVRHIALTINPEGKLARHPGVEAVLLDPRANDRGLAMTSSFTNLVLAGCLLARPEETAAGVPVLCQGAGEMLAQHEVAAATLAERPPARVAALASAPLLGAAREACLKILEMTGGRVATLAETYLGLRHGPMSFLEPDSVVICFVSSDPRLRRYEMDLVEELRGKRLGRLVALAPDGTRRELFDLVLATRASTLPDWLRTPVEIIFPQLLAWHLSSRLGLDPDNPSPSGVIHRVVQGVRIYEE
jgi:tagatose-6-phosphate ketose/aldose isomerase